MTLAITNGTLIDGNGGDPVTNATVLAEGERITAAGAGIDVPRDAEVIDAGGRTIMPGMIDAHVHFYGRLQPLQDRLLTPPSLNLFYGAENARRTLDAGFTAVRDAGGTPLGFKMAIDRGLIPGPRMKISVSILSQTGGHGDQTMPAGINTAMFGASGPEKPNTIVDGPDEVRRAVRELLRAGADFIKLCSTGGVMSPSDEPGHTQFTEEEIEVMVHEARAAGKTCMSHAQGTEGIKNALRAGVESIGHGIYLDDEAIDMLKRNGAFLVPTLSAPIWVLRHAERRPDSVLPQSVRKTKEVLEEHKASAARAIAAGVRVAMGTDSGVGVHGTNAEELQWLCEAGMTPMQAIVATTKVGAECIHMQDDAGTIEPGKFADILIVDGDPLADIGILRDKANIPVIVRGGAVYRDAR